MIWHSRLRFAGCCLLWFGGLSGASATAGEREALTAAIVHLAAQQTPQTWRYVYLLPGSQIGEPELAYAINSACGTTATIIRGQQVSDEVVAFDLSQVDPFNTEQLLTDWDAIATNDSWFHVTSELQEGEPLPILAPHLARYAVQEITGKDDKRLDVIAAELSGSVAPIYEGRWLLEQLLDRNYLAFRRVKVGDDFGEILARAGYFYGTSKKQGGIRANYLIRSQITGDQRVVAAIQGTVSPSAATITYDVFDDSETVMARDLATFNTSADGSEAFLPMRNGLIEFLLIDGDFKVVANAPPNLAVDSSIPRGHDSTLRPAISCISCHTQEGRDIYQPIVNDFPKLPTPGLTPAEVAGLRDTFAIALDTPDDAIGRARRDYAAAVGQIVPPDQINELHRRIVQAVHGYRYAMVTPEQQRIELGLPADAELPTPQAGQSVDPLVYLAMAGEALPRKDWDSIRVILAAEVLNDDSGAVD